MAAREREGRAQPDGCPRTRSGNGMPEKNPEGKATQRERITQPLKTNRIIMARITPIDVIKGISGKYGNGSNDYFATNSSSNRIHLAKLTNPYKGPATEKQMAQREKFGTLQAAASAWLNANRPGEKNGPKGTAEYQKAQKLKRAFALSNVNQVLFKYMDENGGIHLPDGSGSEGGSSKPGTTEGGSSKPGTSEGGNTKPGTTEGGSSKPGTTEGGNTKPGTTEGGSSNPGTSGSGTDQGSDGDGNTDSMD